MFPYTIVYIVDGVTTISSSLELHLVISASYNAIVGIQRLAAPEGGGGGGKGSVTDFGFSTMQMMSGWS